MELLQAPQNWPFGIALGVVLALSILQVVALLIGGPIGVGGPSVDADIDVDADLGDWAGALDWLGVGRLPLSILLTMWAAAFGLAGITVQVLARSSSGDYLSTGGASAIAVALSVPLLKLGGMALEPLFPRDETEAVAVGSLLGSEGEIVVGVARRGHPTQARVRDKWGTTHYVLVEPENEGETFTAGQRVMLLKHQPPLFRVIAGASRDFDV